MITVASAGSALKDYYLSVVTKHLNNRVNPLLAKIEKTSENVQGKSVVKLVGCGINGGIGAGNETGNLPKAAENRYSPLAVSLKNLYGRIELSDKVVRSSRQDSGAFVNLLNSEMEGLLEAASMNLSRMLYSDGSGLLGKTVSSSTKVVTVDSAKKFIEGMMVFGTGVVEHRVASVNRAANTVTMEATATDCLANMELRASAANTELLGLEKIMSDSSIIYGASRSAVPVMNANIDSTTTSITESAIQSAIDAVEENSGDNINFIACSYGVRRAFQNHLATYRRNIDTLNLEGGFRALSYNGIPVVADRFCADKTMYLLNTDYIKLYQLGDWEWLEGENGNVLRQIPNTATYTATLVKYAELMCDKISAQASFTNLTEA